MTSAHTKNRKMTRTFLREDRARGKRQRVKNHCGRAAKRPGRVPRALGGHSEWIFRRLTVPNKKVAEGKSVGDMRTDVFEFKNFRAPTGAQTGGPAATSVKQASWVSTRPVRCVHAKNENINKK